MVEPVMETFLQAVTDLVELGKSLDILIVPARINQQ